MLILARRARERIFMQGPDGAQLTITVVQLLGDKVRLGFDCPLTYTILREEVAERQNATSATAIRIPDNERTVTP